MKNRGFSLVELSIVLVILGLLVGGILAGQSLIRASELRSIPADYLKYRTAAHAFRDKYFAIPGDMTNATAFWGSLGGTGSDNACQSISGVAGSTATCNGDGDASLRSSVATFSQIEMYRFWQHLANANMIAGSYTGYAANTSDRVIGLNLPATRLSNVYFFAEFGKGYASSTCCDTYAGNANWFGGKYGRNTLYVASTSGLSTVAGSQPFTPEEAWNIDSKIDDGLPGSGIVLAFKGNGTNTNCTNVAGIVPPGDAGATYLLTNKMKDCTFFFTNAF